MDLSTMITSIAQDLLALQTLAQTFAVGIGLVFCGGALQNAIKKSLSLIHISEPTRHRP